MSKNLNIDNPATAFISAAKNNTKQSPQQEKEKKFNTSNLVKWTVYFDKEKKKRIERISFLEEKHIYEIIDTAIGDYLAKYDKKNSK